MKAIILLALLALPVMAQEPSFRITQEQPFTIHLEPNQQRDFVFADEAWIEPDAYCWLGGNVIRDEFSRGRVTALAYGRSTISAGFRFGVNVKITRFRIEIDD